MIYRRLIVNKTTAKVAKKIIILFLPHLFLYSGPADTVGTSVSTSAVIASQLGSAAMPLVAPVSASGHAIHALQSCYTVASVVLSMPFSRAIHVIG